MKHQIVQPSNLSPAILTVEGASNYLSLSWSTIYELMDAGKLIGLSIRSRGQKRGSRRFRLSDLDAFIAQAVEENELQKKEGA